VLTANSAGNALKLFGCNHVDAVITDHLLPDLTGAELVGEMKRLKPEVRIILLTGLIEMPSGYDLADLVLTKCITPPEFLSEIAKLLGRPPGGQTKTA